MFGCGCDGVVVLVVVLGADAPAAIRSCVGSCFEAYSTVHSRVHM